MTKIIDFKTHLEQNKTLTPEEKVQLLKEYDELSAYRRQKIQEALNITEQVELSNLECFERFHEGITQAVGMLAILMSRYAEDRDYTQEHLPYELDRFADALWDIYEDVNDQYTIIMEQD